MATGRKPPRSVGGNPTPNPFEMEAYTQICEDFRQLNQVFWQAPVIIISITGGIGLAIATVESSALRVVLLLMASACNLAWAAMIVRLRRGVMARLLRQKHAFEATYVPGGAGAVNDTQFIMKTFVVLLCAVAAACLISTFFVRYLFPNKDDDRARAEAKITLVGSSTSHSQLCVRQQPTVSRIATASADQEAQLRLKHNPSSKQATSNARIAKDSDSTDSLSPHNTSDCQIDP